MGEDGRRVELWAVPADASASRLPLDGRGAQALAGAAAPTTCLGGRGLPASPSAAFYLAIQPIGGPHAPDRHLRKRSASPPCGAIRLLGDDSGRALTPLMTAGAPAHPPLAPPRSLVERRPRRACPAPGLRARCQVPGRGRAADLHSFARSDVRVLHRRAAAGSDTPGQPTCRPELPARARRRARAGPLDGPAAGGRAHRRGARGRGRPAPSWRRHPLACLQAPGSRHSIRRPAARAPAAHARAAAPAPARPSASRSATGSPGASRSLRVGAPGGRRRGRSAAGSGRQARVVRSRARRVTISSGTDRARPPRRLAARAAPLRVASAACPSQSALAGAGAGDGRIEAGLMSGTLPSRVGARVAHTPGNPATPSASATLQAHVWRNVRGAWRRRPAHPLRRRDRWRHGQRSPAAASPPALSRCNAAAGSLAVPESLPAEARPSSTAWTTPPRPR